MTAQAAHTLLSRRALLAQGGALVVTFALTSRPIHAEAARPADKTVAADEVAGFIAIDATGKVTIYSGKVELGTGAITAIAQIAAEELCVPLDRVTMIQGDTQLTPNQGPTYASLTIQNGGMQIRRAAATAREALLQRAADKLKVAKDTLTVQDGVVTSRAGGDKLSYAQLIGEQQLAMKIDPAAPLKDPKDYTIVGTSVPRRDIPGKIFGTFNFVQDHKLPGMLHARVVHPAGVRSTLQSFDDTACRKIKGYVRAVRKGNLLAVVATNEWAAISASKAIVAKWSDWAGLTRGVAALRVRAQLEGRPQRGAANGRRHGRRVQARQTNAAGDVRLRDADPRIDRPILRGRRFQGRPPDRMDALAGKPSAASAARDDAELEARERALHLRGRCGLLRPQRRRRLLFRSSRDRQGNRQAGATAMDAAGRARLGSEGPSRGARLSRQHR